MKTADRRWSYLLALLVATCLALMPPARAQAQEDVTAAPLELRLTPEVLTHIFPSVTRISVLDDGGPPAAAAYAGDELVGYLFSTLDVLRAPGYTTTPFDVVAGVTLGGRITGAAALFHREPYLINDKVRTAQLVEFLDRMDGMEARLGASGGPPVGYVAGATISARAMRNAVLEGGRLVLRYRTDTTPVTEPTPDMLSFRPMDGDSLVAAGGLARAVVTNADLAAAMDAAGLSGMEPEVTPRGGPGAVYLDLRLGYAMPPMIGRNGSGQGAYDRLVNVMPPGSEGLIFASQGLYDHRGTRYNNLSHAFLLERLAVFQGDRTWQFHKADLIAGTYALGKVTDLLVLPPGSGFDPLAPWRAEVYGFARDAGGALHRFTMAGADYALPADFIRLPEVAQAPAWLEPWSEGRGQIAVMLLALTVLTLILAFQDRLARSRRAHRLVRMGFLAFTLVWIGWVAGAQLSIVHLIGWIKAPLEGLGLAYYLAEPLIAILAVYTALSLLVLGRGVFCGWLCPFGALQELLAQAARALRLPQWNPPEAVQARLWNVKYLALAVVVGLAFAAPALGDIAAEVEPFKTAITAMFARALPYVVWAVVLLGVGLFTERAFCRFLCPLGAALALADRLHLVTLLKRRPECGTPCRLCERSCPVKAIGRSGQIKMSECFQCLDCMVEYHDDRRCPPLAWARKAADRMAVPAAVAAK